VSWTGTTTTTKTEQEQEQPEYRTADTEYCIAFCAVHTPPTVARRSEPRTGTRTTTTTSYPNRDTFHEVVRYGYQRNELSQSVSQSYCFGVSISAQQNIRGASVSVVPLGFILL
jgi:hypothetical protein